MNAESSIQVGVIDGVVWVRVEGRGSFQNSTALREFAKSMLARGHVRFVIDLLGCPLMDSTFMGTLAGIALKLHGVQDGGVEVVNLNDRTRSLLSNLGLDQILRLRAGDAGVAGPSECPEGTCVLPLGANDKLAQARTMLAAHEAVVEANPQNAVKFKDVLEYLRQDLAAESRR